MVWEKVGEIAVDAGIVMIGDPCYTQGQDASSAVATWSEFLERTWPETFGPGAAGREAMGDAVPALGEEATGIVVSSGYGDGSYPVYVEREDGRVKAAKIVFF
jgi:hypothetical protein